MNDDDLGRIRENQEQVDERLRERRCELQQSFRKLGDLEDSLAIAWKVGLTGIIPSIVWIVRQGLHRSETSFVDGLAVVIIGLIGLAIVTPFVPIGCGTGAHYLFRSSMRSTRLMAVVLSVLADAAIFGWVLFLVRD
jgi:hypothetical protein